MSTEEIAALSKGLLSTDASRRVGWARAFSAEASKDELLREINLMRGQRDLMRIAASFFYGFLLQRATYDESLDATTKRLASRLRELDAVMDSNEVLKGRKAATDLEVFLLDQTERRARRAEQTQARQASGRRLWKNARDAERKALMAEFGVPNEAALLNYLALYKET